MKRKPPRPPKPPAPPAGEPPLFPPDETPEAGINRQARFYLNKMETDGLFTGERLKEINPTLFFLVRDLIAENRLSQRQIADYCHVSPNTVRAIARAETGSIDALRARLADVCAELERATLERLQERMDNPEEEWTHLELAAVLREVGKRSDALAGRDIAGALRDQNTAAGIGSLAEAAAARREKIRALRKIDADVTIHSNARPAPPREALPPDPQVWTMTPTGIKLDTLHCQIIVRKGIA